MEDRGLWWKYMRRAAAESSVPARNWRWMLASLGIGAELGLVAGLQRLGMEPARITEEVAATIVRAALFVFVTAWLAAVAVRFGAFSYPKGGRSSSAGGLWTYHRHSQPAVARVRNRPRTCVNIFSWISGLFALLSFGTK
jgi:hypothetical protein